jgi:hypothetical protein
MGTNGLILIEIVRKLDCAHEVRARPAILMPILLRLAKLASPFGATMPRNLTAVNKGVKSMKENVQNLFNGSKRFPSFILSRMNTGKALGGLLLAVIAIAFSLSNPQRTSSAVVKNTEGLLPVQEPSPTPACATIPSENCVPDANGNPICCSTDAVTGDRTCRFQSTTCQVFDNPCDPDNPVFASVNTTLTIHSHTDRHGGRHFHTQLRIHGTGITEEEFEQCNSDNAVVARGNKETGKGFAFVKASTNQGRDVVTLVKDSSFNSSGPPPETFSDPLTFHIITGGRAPNFRVHTVMHFTENANGEMTACVGKEKTSSCGENF